MRSILLIITAIIFIFAACNPAGKQENKESVQAEVPHEEHEDMDHADMAIEIDLENGEKWIINEEMKPFLAESEAMINSFIEMGSDDHTRLAADLKSQNEALIKSCTMTGKSHDELHKWLHPHLDLVKQLSEADTKSEAEALLVQLSHSFETFHRYFQ